MDRLINKIIRIFKKRYFVVVFLFVCIITLLGVTYSYWTAESGWKLASQIKFKELTYIMNIDDVNVSTINVSANSGTTYYDIEITSLNEINTRYLLVYNSDVSTVEVALSSSSINDASGVIGLYESGAGGEKTKNIRIAITNETSSAAIIELEVVGGYTWNPESAIDVTTGYNRIDEIHDEVITRGLTLAEELNQIMGCTPTSSSACLMKENSANYLTYSSKSWRIIGTYLVGGEYVTKLILNEPLTTKVTYANAASELTTFYNTLDTSLIKTSAPFVCTGTTNIACTGSANIGLISKAEYDVIKGVNSYLYTKPNKEYWLNDTYYTGTSRGAVNTDSSSLAYVRPVIYLKSNTIETAKTSTSTSITNLITNGGFEDGTTGWTLPNSNSSITTDNKNSGSKSLKISMTTGTISVDCSSPVQAVREHIVYASVYKYIPFYSYGYSLFEFYNGSEYALVSGTGYEDNLNHNQSINSWTFYSLRGTVRNYNSISICARMGCGVTCSITEYYDDLLLVDLTATFGAGNEPSKAWCDENLEYFDGTTTINTKVGTVGTSGTPYTVTTGIQLTVNLDGGSSNIKTGYYQSGAAYTFTTPTKSGSAFAGWTVNGTGTSISGTTLTMGSASSTLLATWTSDFTLTYNNQSGSGCTTKTVTYNEQYGTLCTPTRTGYTFDGWYTGPEGSGTQVTATTTVTTASNHTIYAKWVGYTYTVVYNSVGGSGTTSSSTHTYGVAKTLTANGFSKIATGTSGMIYRFLGWSTTSGGSVAYSNSQSVSNLSATNGATVNLYAVWGNLFTYTGSSYYVDGTASSWIIRLKSVGSYTITFAVATTVDAFVVGGGGGGGGGKGNYAGGGGGGSGYVATYTSVPALSANTSYAVYVGAGGAGGAASASTGSSGTQSYFISTTYNAEGGSGGASSSILSGGAGGAGGCGGGGGGSNGGEYQQVSGSGGFNGTVGVKNGTDKVGDQGSGSGVTTCEFGGGTAQATACNSGVQMYGGGGAGGSGSRTGNVCAVNVGTAGTPGGGTGGLCVAGGDGVANTGGGGGGGGSSLTSIKYAGGNGGSGIVVLKNH